MNNQHFLRDVVKAISEKKIDSKHFDCIFFVCLQTGKISVQSKKPYLVEITPTQDGWRVEEK